MRSLYFLEYNDDYSLGQKFIMKTLLKSDIIHSDPDILGGITVFVGTRVPVKTLLDYLEAGDSLDIFLEHFPSVKKEQAIAVGAWHNSLVST
jgi:uncharacterized protein (DUF433 family)